MRSLGKTWDLREDGQKVYGNVEGRTPERMVGVEMADHQRSKRSPMQRDLGFRRRRGGESHEPNTTLCSRYSKIGMMSSTPRVLRFCANLTPSAVLYVVLSNVAELCFQMWTFRESMSSYLDFARSLSPVVLSCLLGVVSLSPRC
jgi:hypothetical protein